MSVFFDRGKQIPIGLYFETDVSNVSLERGIPQPARGRRMRSRASRTGATRRIEVSKRHKKTTRSETGNGSLLVVCVRAELRRGCLLLIILPSRDGEPPFRAEMCQSLPALPKVAALHLRQGFSVAARMHTAAQWHTCRCASFSYRQRTERDCSGTSGPVSVQACS